MSALDGKTALVTGGGGFIGGTLVAHLCETGIDTVRVLDNDEHALFGLQQRSDVAADRLDFRLGDLRDADRVVEAMAGVDVVYHAGAIKRVELSEANPFQAVRTNVHGTRNVVRAAAAAGVESATIVSTDKASNPSSVMGATKLLAERIVIAANADPSASGTRFNCVRFGNVLGSTGSVVSIFFDQLESGGPITVTDPEMTRFIMPVDRAVSLLLDANERMGRGEIAVLKMPAFRVGDLAEALRSAYAPVFGYSRGEVEIEVRGKRPGERVHEKLVSLDEAPNVHELDDVFVIRPELAFEGGEHDGIETQTETPFDGEYTSADAERLTRDELVAMVEEHLDPPSASTQQPPQQGVRSSQP